MSTCVETEIEYRVVQEDPREVATTPEAYDQCRWGRSETRALLITKGEREKTKMLSLKPSYLCDQHLLLEHREMHQMALIVESDNKAPVYQQKLLEKRIKEGLLETHNIKQRHDEVVAEMLRRHMKHTTPMSFSTKTIAGHLKDENVAQHLKKCFECRQQMADSKASEADNVS